MTKAKYLTKWIVAGVLSLAAGIALTLMGGCERVDVHVYLPPETGDCDASDEPDAWFADAATITDSSLDATATACARDADCPAGERCCATDGYRCFPATYACNGWAEVTDASAGNTTMGVGRLRGRDGRLAGGLRPLGASDVPGRGGRDARTRRGREEAYPPTPPALAATVLIQTEVRKGVRP